MTPSSPGWNVFGLAFVALLEGDLDGMASNLDQALALSRRLYQPWGIAWAQFSLGVLHIIRGDLAAATGPVTESLELRWSIRDPRGTADCLGVLAYLASMADDLRWAARLHGANEVLREANGLTLLPFLQPLHDESVERILGLDRRGGAGRAVGPGPDDPDRKDRGRGPFAAQRLGTARGAAASTPRGRIGGLRPLIAVARAHNGVNTLLSLFVERAPQTGGGRAAIICALVGAAWLGAHALGFLGPFDSLTFAAIAAGATAAVTIGIMRYRPRPRWVWACGLVSMLLFFVGGVLREVFGTLGDLSPSRAWYPEPFTMLGYVALGVSLFAVARSHLGDRWNDRVATLDAFIAGLAALALAWIFLITPALEQESMPFGARVALALYPAFSAFLVTAGFRIGFAAENHPPIAFRIWMCALVAMLVGDIFYMLVELHFLSYERWIDLPYGLAYVLIATAALHPTMKRVTEPVSVAVATPRRGLVLVAIAVCVPGFVMLAQPDTQAVNRVALAGHRVGADGRRRPAGLLGPARPRRLRIAAQPPGHPRHAHRVAEPGAARIRAGRAAP